MFVTLAILVTVYLILVLICISLFVDLSDVTIDYQFSCAHYSLDLSFPLLIVLLVKVQVLSRGLQP